MLCNMGSTTTTTTTNTTTTIGVLFACKSCNSYFPEIRDFIEHKEENHFSELKRTSCIVFDERINHDHDNDTSLLHAFSLVKQEFELNSDLSATEISSSHDAVLGSNASNSDDPNCDFLESILPHSPQDVNVDSGTSADTKIIPQSSKFVAENKNTDFVPNPNDCGLLEPKSELCIYETESVVNQKTVDGSCVLPLTFKEIKKPLTFYFNPDTCTLVNETLAQSEIKSDVKTRKPKAHNTVERTRRGEITNRFSELRKLIPNLHSNSKCSKVRILQSSTEYIEKLKALEKKNLDEEYFLKVQNETLQNRLAELSSNSFGLKQTSEVTVDGSSDPLGNELTPISHSNRGYHSEDNDEIIIPDLL